MLAHLHTFVSILRRNDTCSNATFAKSNRLESQAIPNNELLPKLPIWVEVVLALLYVIADEDMAQSVRVVVIDRCIEQMLTENTQRLVGSKGK